MAPSQSLDDELEEMDDITHECDILPNGRWVSIIGSEFNLHPSSFLPNGSLLFLIAGSISIHIISETTSSLIFNWEFNSNLEMTCFDGYEVAFTPTQLEEYLKLHIQLAYSYMYQKSVIEESEKTIHECVQGFVSEIRDAMIHRVQKM